MASEGLERKLAAILSADVVGYSRMMSEDEEGTVRLITVYREQVGTLVRDHRGRLVDFTGDCFLAEFPTALDAVESAIEIQRVLRARNATLAPERQMLFRLGVHLGDVRADGERLYGDGVNIAARLEGLADPGGLCISGAVHEQVCSRLDAAYEDLGAQRLKNIANPVQAYRVGIEAAVPKPSRSPPKGIFWAGAALLVLGLAGWSAWPRLSRELVQQPLPDRPSIAVLAFNNLSGDAEQEFFSDGLTIDIITALSRFPELFVVSQDAAFQFKGRAADVREVGRSLGVRYVLRGDVRRDADQLRVATRLIDAETGEHLWAETYDRALTARNLYAVQDDIAQKVVATVADPAGVIARLGQSERRARPTQSLDAYTCVLRAYSYYLIHDAPSHLRARECLERSVEADPDYGDAWAHLSYLYSEEYHHRFNLRPGALDRALRAGLRAVDLDPANPRAHFGLAMTYARRREIVSSLASAERALALNPSDSIIAAGLGNTIAYSGDWERGLAVSLRAASLNPVRPRWQDVLLAAHDYQQGEYEEALAQLPKIRGGRGDEQVILHTAASYGQLGRAAEARAALDSLLEIQPHYAEDARAELQRLYPSDAMVDRLLDGLRKAGLESGS